MGMCPSFLCVPPKPASNIISYMALKMQCWQGYLAQNYMR